MKLNNKFITKTIIKMFFSYSGLAIVAAVLSLLSIPFLQGTNTGEDMCVYVSEETKDVQPNWSYMGEPCVLTKDAYIIFITGYLGTFIFLFSCLGFMRFVFGRILNRLCSHKVITKE